MKRKNLFTLGIVVVLVFALTVSASALFGFGEDDEEKQEEVTITFSTGNDTTGANTKIVEKFEEEHPNINVEYVEQPNSSDKQHDTYVTKLNAESSSVDVFSVDVIWPAEFAAAGWLLPLDDYIDQDKFLPGTIEATSYQGTLYAVPWFTDAGLLYYRKDIVDEAPETWDELYTKAQKHMGEKGTKMGFTFQAKQYEGLVCDFLEYVWANGGQVLDGQEVVINSPENVEALKFFKKLVQSDMSPEGITTYDEPASLKPFKEGLSVFHRNWPYAWGILQSENAKMKGKVGVTPMPKGPNGDSGAATLGGWNLAVNKYTDNKEAAVEFVKFVTSYEMQKFNAVESARNPTRKAVYDDEEVIEANPFMEKLYDVFINARPRPTTPVYPQVSNVIQEQVHKALHDVKTSEQALKDAQAEIEEIMKQVK